MRLLWSMCPLLVLTLSGCTVQAVHVKKAGQPVLLAGWQLGKDDRSGVQIGIPPGWRVGMDTAVSSSGVLAQMGADLPPSTDPGSVQAPGGGANPLQKFQDQIISDSAKQEKEDLEGLRAKGIVLHVIDGSKPIIGEERTRFTVEKLDRGHNLSFSEARDEEVEAFKGWGAGAPTLVNLPIGPTYRIESDYKTRGGDEVERICYIAIDGPNLYLLKFISTNNPQVVLSIEKDVAASWRISGSL